MSPRELDLLIEADRELQRDRFWPAAMVASVIANVNRGKDTEPFEPADFMPGAKTKEQELREWADAVMRGEKFEADPEAAAEFKKQMQASFSNLKAHA